VRKAPPPQEAHWRKAWAGSITLHDRDGKELGTRMYGAEANTDPNALADRVAADIAAVVRAHPDVKVHCVQDAAPELRALPEALTRARPPGKSYVELVDLEHLCRDYLDVGGRQVRTGGRPARDEELVSRRALAPRRRHRPHLGAAA
jgi:hypothetical protein